DISMATITGPEILTRDSVLNKFFDALAAGKPVAHNYRGFSALVAEEAGAGLILDRDNKRAAAEQLVRALGDKQWLTRAGAAARRLGLERFNLDDLAIRL